MKVKGVNKGERQQLWKKGDCPKPKKQDEIAYSRAGSLPQALGHVLIHGTHQEHILGLPSCSLQRVRVSVCIALSAFILEVFLTPLVQPVSG